MRCSNKLEFNTVYKYTVTGNSETNTLTGKVNRQELIDQYSNLVLARSNCCSLI